MIMIKKFIVIAAVITAALSSASCDFIDDIFSKDSKDSQVDSSEVTVITNEKIVGTVTDFGSKSKYTTSISSIDFSNDVWDYRTDGEDQELLLNCKKAAGTMGCFALKDSAGADMELEDYCKNRLFRINFNLRLMNMEKQKKEKADSLERYKVTGTTDLDDGTTVSTTLYIYKKKDMVVGIFGHTLPDEDNKKFKEEFNKVVKTFKFTDDNIIKDDSSKKSNKTK